MNETEPAPVIPPEVVADLQRLLADFRGGIRDPEAARLAREEMDRIREKNGRLFGEQNIAVELIRQGRDRSA